MGETGKNITPDKIAKDESQPLFDACDTALKAIALELKIDRVIGVGKFAEKQAASTFAGTVMEISSILHPSPASPLANRGWASAAEGSVAGNGSALAFTP